MLRLRLLMILTFCPMLSMSALLPYPRRFHRQARHDYNFERNCFFSPAQCLLGNFPRSSKLEPVLSVFEDTSLNKIYAKMLDSNTQTALFGSWK
uniref:Secreted protein n=1 Tax=Caenorhabditis japonica TaxID=281687 RepID=A0A8R1HPF3_CAEJA